MPEIKETQKMVADTKASKLFAEETPVDDNSGLVANNEVREHFGGAVDALTIFPDERKRFGISSDEVPFLVRNPNYYQKVEGLNRVREVQNTLGGRVVRDGAGDEPWDGTDVVLMAVPRAVVDKRDAEMLEANREYEATLEPDPNRQGGVRSYERIGPSTEQERREKAEWDHKANVAAGLIGAHSPTSQMSYTQAASRYTKEQILAEEAMYRSGPTRRALSDDEWSNMLEDRTRRVTQHFSGSGFPRNPNSPLAQAQRRTNPAGG